MTHALWIRRARLPGAILAMLVIILGLSGATGTRIASAQGQPTPRLYLPIVSKSYLTPEGRLCRLGVAGTSAIDNYNVSPLRIGWYMDWQAWTKPARPGGIAYAATVRLFHDPDDPNRESYKITSPDPKTITATVQANPGMIWLIGNEPDRPRLQDGVEPQVYAKAYHDLYYMIKSLDSTAQFAAGNIVEPTALRLQYLDLILANYQRLYKQAMPVDIWSIHTYPLPEVRYSCDPNSWGADIPPGIDGVCHGATYDVADSGDPTIFRQFVADFRVWMNRRGYANRPLILPEWGVLMPYITASQVNSYMTDTMNWLLTATGPDGYPADNNRLVQRAAWFSLNIITIDNKWDFNGWLFDPASKGRTVFGDNFAAQTASIVPRVNLRPAALSATSGRIVAQVVNNGNVSTSRPFSIRFYNGPPAGGSQIGQDQTIAVLDGCASAASVGVDALPGTYNVYVVVDPTNEINENKADNQLSANVNVP